MSTKLQTFEAMAKTGEKGQPWYAIRVRSRLEKLVSAALRGKGYEEWLPLYRARHQWSDRVKQLDLPLFPGYIFCRFDVHDRLVPILTTPGVLAIVGAGKTPIPVPDDEMAAVQSIVRSGLAVQPWPSLNVGSQVCIQRGALAGITGTVLNVDKTCRLVLSIPLLQRAVAVEIDRDWVRPLTAPFVAPLTETQRISKYIA
jgi:transcription antitermination factor NusG